MKLTVEERQALGNILVTNRNEQNLTQEKLAAMSGVPVRTLQRAERGDGISQENLDLVAMKLGTDAATLLQLAAATKAGSPDLRSNLEAITTAAELVRHMQGKRGVLQVAPEGEHAFNEHVGPLVLELGEMPVTKARKEADNILQFCAQMGFALFVGRYNEELEHNGKMLRNPTTVVFAAPLTDPRVRKTPKGRVLDYIVDRRKQLWHRVLKGGLTAYDWMEDQLISKSTGEARVRAELLRIHQDIRRQTG